MSFGLCKENLYLTDKNSVHVFNLPHLKRINKFVKKGVGPKEFSTTPTLKTYDDKLLIFNPFKVALYTPAGELISEKKLPAVALKAGYVGGNYIIQKYDYTNIKTADDYKIAIGVYNHSLEKIKDISFSENPLKEKSGNKRIRPLVLPIFKFAEYNGKIFLVDRRTDFHISIFDEKGNPAGIIHKKYTPLKISGEYKIRRFEKHKNTPVVKKRWHLLKKTFKYTFPEYFPAIQDFFVADNKVYVKTYLVQGGKEEYWILKTDGKLIKKALLPAAINGYWCFYKNRFWYIFENDDEEWECHSLQY